MLSGFPALAAVFALVNPLAAPLAAQADAPAPPTTLAAMRNLYRPLIIFSGGNAKLTEQQMTVISSHAADAHQRQLLLVGVQGTKTDVPSVLLAPAEQERAEHRFHATPGQFTVVLLGKDGGEKLRAHAPVSWERLRALIDSMPMRQQEIHKP